MPFSTVLTAAGNSLICEKPRIDDASLPVSLMFTDRPAYPQKIPTVPPAVVSEICAISHQSSEATNKMSVHYPGEATNEYDFSFPSRETCLKGMGLGKRCFSGRNIKKVLDGVRVRKNNMG